MNKPIELLRWSWRRALHGLVVGMTVGLITGIITGIITGLLYAFPLQNTPDYGFQLGFTMGFTYGPFAGFALMLFLGLIGLLLYGLSKENLENRTYPNQGIRQSIKNAGIVIFVTGLAFAVLGLVVSPLIYSLLSVTIIEFELIEITMATLFIGASVGFFIGVLLGGIFSLYYGMYAVIYHYCIRLILSNSEKVPFRLLPFLDYCVDRIFLRRVGGGYIFVHRLLMEHFAAMYSGDEKAT